MEWELGMGGYCRVTFSSRKQAFQIPIALLRRMHMGMGVCARVAISVYVCVYSWVTCTQSHKTLRLRLASQSQLKCYFANVY